MINIMALYWQWQHWDAGTDSHDGGMADIANGNEKMALQLMGNPVKTCDAGYLEANDCFDGHSELYWQNCLWFVDKDSPCKEKSTDQAHIVGTH